MSMNNRSKVSVIREVVGAEVLIIDQDKRVQEGMAKLLSRAQLHVTCVDNPEQGIELLAKRFFSVVVVDLDTPIPSAGISTVAAIKDSSATSMIVLLTPRKSFDDTVAAMRAGAIDVVFKAPESVEYLLERIREAASRSVDTREVNLILGEVKSTYDQFLKLFMDAERRAMESAERLAGRDPERVDGLDEIRLLVVSSDGSLADALNRDAPAGCVFHSALSGGQALDLCSSNTYHYVLVAENLFDLPSSMITRSIKAQSPESVVLAFSGPGPGGKVELVEANHSTPVITDFTHPRQLLDRIDELAEAFRIKSRERRYAQAFRERHYDFLRRYVNLKTKLDRTMPGSS